MNGAKLPDAPFARALRLTLRACRLRCPACGGGPVFDGWFAMRRAGRSLFLAFDLIFRPVADGDRDGPRPVPR